MWYVAWCRLAIGYLGFRTTNWAHLQASGSSRRKLETCGDISRVLFSGRVGKPITMLEHGKEKRRKRQNQSGHKGEGGKKW